MPTWFENAGKQRESIVYTQKRQILMMYRALHKEVKNVLEKSKLPDSFKTSGYLKKVFIASIENNLEGPVDGVVSQVDPVTKQNMKEAAIAVMEDDKEFLREIGIDDELIEDVHDLDEETIEEIISMISSGQLYDKKWSLSDFSKREKEKIMSDVQKIVKKCVEEEMNFSEIKKYLDMYFNPDKQKDSNFFKLFTGVKGKIYYDVMRTMTTLVGHSYEETFVNTTIDNPFIEGYRWITSGSDRVCPVCIDRESTDKFGLGIGIFPKDKLPLDHPNGMCTFDPVYIMPTGEIIREIDLWKQGKGSMKDKINKWLKKK